ncbi:MAG: hypothetical protein WDO71_20175 [Bacteroidota bacterium]
MKLHQSISHLTKQEQTDLRYIVKTISAGLQPALVFCFGIRLSQQLRRSCFTQKRRNESHHAVYDLLIILHDNDTLQEDTAATVAQRMIGDAIKTNMLVHRFSVMKEKLPQMNFFFSWMHRSAILLINRDNSLSQLLPQKKKTDILPVSKETFVTIKEGLDKAKSLLAAIQEQWPSQSYDLTLQTIREAAGEIMKALIKTGLGYEARNCSVATMIKLTENFSDMVSVLFPGNTAEERQLYLLLTEAGYR